MASGLVRRANRPNTWLHRPACGREESPCQLGAVRTWPAALSAALTGRTHGCTDQPAGVKKVLANSEPSTHAGVKKVLANSEPSTHGTGLSHASDQGADHHQRRRDQRRLHARARRRTAQTLGPAD